MKKVVYSVILIFLSQLCFSKNIDNYYTIQIDNNTNLYKVARKHLATFDYWRELLLFNKLKSPKKIIPGMTLKIPYSIARTRIAKLKSLYGKTTHNLYNITNNYKIIKDNSSINTSDNTKAIITLDSGSTITLNDNMDIYLADMYRTKNLSKTIVRLNNGGVNITIPYPNTEHIIILSSGSKIELKPGVYFAKTYPNGTVKLAVYYGELTINKQNNNFTIKQGYGVVIPKDLYPQKPFELPKQIKLN